MARQHYFEDRFTNGVWYDLAVGEAVRLSREDGEVVFSDIDGDEVDRIDIEAFEPNDYRKVSDEALDDPVSVVESVLDDVATDSIPSHGISMETYANLQTARELIEIEES